MKKLIILFLFAALNMSVFAQNKLTIFSEIGEQFYLILNGIRQNENPETNVQVEGLSADYYSAKIIFNNASIADVDKKFLNTVGAECKPCAVTYKIKLNKKGEIVMKMFGATPIAQAPVNPNVTVVNYNTAPMPAPVLGVQVTETTTTHHHGGGDHVNVGVNVGGFNMNVNVNDGYGGSSHTSTTTTTTTTVIPAEVIVEETCPAMTFSNFNSLVNTLFEWEEAKLTYAKHAYATCYDPNNYYQVNDEFEWSDNVKSLNEYIAK